MTTKSNLENLKVWLNIYDVNGDFLHHSLWFRTRLPVRLLSVAFRYVYVPPDLELCSSREPVETQRRNLPPRDLGQRRLVSDLSRRIFSCVSGFVRQTGDFIVSGGPSKREGTWQNDDCCWEASLRGIMGGWVSLIMLVLRDELSCRFNNHH